jgi:two-component system, sensor histidine kinase and response regulator
MAENNIPLMERPYKVLIVDDVPENIQILVHLLKEKGLRVNYTDSGAKALKAIKSNLPDLILLDISMPDMDGLEVCERLKKDESTADIPVIFLTAKVDQQDVINGLEMGAVDYVTKPFNARELITRVFTHIELKHNRDLIKKQNLELSRLNDVKNQLFSVISHDMKNLFNNILFGTESLEKEIEFYSKDEIIQVAGVINESAKSAYNLLQNLLDWSRSQMKSIVLRPVNSEIAILVNQTVSLLKPASEKKNITFDVKIEGIFFEAIADVEMVNSTLRNLLSNAIKYSYPDGRVEILVRELPESIEVKIKDHGIGMDSDIMARIKSGLRPSDSVPGTKNEKGSGLGLLLVKDFVEKNNGKFDFVSQKGKGSEFWFYLPKNIKLP